MMRPTLILLPCILSLASPAMADDGLEKAPAAHARPLNLSLPRDMPLHAPTHEMSDETVLRNLQAPTRIGNGPNAGSPPSSLPYGAGYEHRHRDTQGAGASGGAAAGASRGAGRRGR
jgi:hypothetical protein